MHKIRTISIDDPGVCQSACHAGGCAETTEQIDVLLGVKTPDNPKAGGPHPPTVTERGFDTGLCRVSLCIIL